MELTQLLSFLSASLILSIMPGPDNIFVLTESITKGPRNGVAISVGLSTGVLIHTLAAATGLSLIIQQSEFVFSLIKYMGAAYLLYLAAMAYKEERVEVNTENDLYDHKFDFLSLIKKGFLMNVLNPKVSLFFIAFLPQFVNKNGVNITLQMIVLGVVFMIQSLMVFSGVSYLSGSLNRYINNPRFWKITRWSKIVVLSLLALALICSQK